MDELLKIALQDFQSGAIEKQRDILWQYVLYVETVVTQERGDPCKRYTDRRSSSPLGNKVCLL